MVQEKCKKGEMFLEKLSPHDIGKKQDQAFAIMHLVSMEGHSLYSAMKALDNDDEGMYKFFMELHKRYRKIRGRHLKDIIDDTSKYESWCLVKHIFGSTMRLLETAYKCEGEKRQRYIKDALFVFNSFWIMMEKVTESE